MSVPPQGPSGGPDEPRKPKGGTCWERLAGVAAGVSAFVAINFGVGFLSVGAALEGRQLASRPAVAIFLALIALGVGIALVLTRRPVAKGMGIGLMIGWALMSVLTAGECTGLRPGVFS